MEENVIENHTSVSENEPSQKEDENTKQEAPDISIPDDIIKDKGDQRIVKLRPRDATEDNDDKIICITREAVKQSKLINEMLQEDDDDVAEVPLMEIDFETLQKVVMFMKHHEHDPMTMIPAPLPKSELTNYVSSWDYFFVNHRQKDKPNWLDGPPLLALGFASDYLDIPPLLELVGAMIASVIRDMEPDEIYEMFGIDRPNEETDKRTRWNPEFDWALDFNS